MFKICLDTAKVSVGELELSWHNVSLGADTGDK